MSDGIYAALSGAIAQQRSLDVVANNVANASTHGYRGDRVAFRQELANAGGNGPAPDALRYVSVSQVSTDATQGALQETGNTFDLALQGEGHFVVETPNGFRYTRAGSFTTDAEGVLRTQDGHRVMGVPEDPARIQPVEIRVPEGTVDVAVAADGTVRAGDGVLGQLRVVDIQGGEKEGFTLFTARNAEASTNTSVVQGYLESSNINAVAGLNELITVSRSFEAFQKVIETFAQMDARTARDIAKR